MNSKSIELLLFQLAEAFSRSRGNIYSNEKKENHFEDLHKLYSAIKESNYNSLAGNDLITHFYLLDYIFKGLEYLDNSTLNIVPYEIISCLELALEDWLDTSNLIVVTSLSNRNLDFYFEAVYTKDYIDNLNSYIDSKYNLTIRDRLIRIGLPKVLSRDYLSMVALYHELGHFVDKEFKISEKIFLDRFGYKSVYNESEIKFLNHQQEYFADLFASQYINDASSLFLSHITINDNESNSHPSTSVRVETVDKFLQNRDCQELTQFNIVLSASGLEELKIRHNAVELTGSQLLELIPQDFFEKESLHYVFKLGWEFWKDSENNILKEFELRQRFQIINNLIEKSISNYFIVTKWKGLNP